MVPVLIAVVAFSGVLSNIEGAIALLARIYARVKKAVLPHAATPEQLLALAGYSDIDSVIPSTSRSSIIRLSKGSTPVPQWTGATSTLGALTIIVLLGVLLAVGNIGTNAIDFPGDFRGLGSSLSTVTIHADKDQGSTEYVSVSGQVWTLLPPSPDTEVVVFEKQGTGSSLEPSSGGWYAVGHTTPTTDGSWAIARLKVGESQSSRAHSPVQVSTGVASSESAQMYSWTATAPSAMYSVAPSSSSVAVSWVDNSSNETSFVLYRFNGSTSANAPVGASVNSYTDTGLQPLTTDYSRDHRAWAQNSAARGDSAPLQYRLSDAPAMKSTKKVLDGRSSTSTLEFTAVLVRRNAIPMGTHIDNLEQLRPKILSSFARSVVVPFEPLSTAKH